VRGTANADLAAFHKVDARRAGFNAHVAAAVQDGPHLSLQDLGAHWSSHADGLAFNDAHSIGKCLIGARSTCGDQRRTEDARQAAGSRARRQREIELEMAITR